ncbi:unnamed protein product [Musa acuminata subsp. burmannicoides]
MAEDLVDHPLWASFPEAENLLDLSSWTTYTIPTISELIFAHSHGYPGFPYFKMHLLHLLVGTSLSDCPYFLLYVNIFRTRFHVDELFLVYMILSFGDMNCCLQSWPNVWLTLLHSHGDFAMLKTMSASMLGWLVVVNPWWWANVKQDY